MWWTERDERERELGRPERPDVPDKGFETLSYLKFLTLSSSIPSRQGRVTGHLNKV